MQNSWEFPMEDFTDANFPGAAVGLKEPEDPTWALSFFFFLPQIHPLHFLRAPVPSLWKFQR